MKNVAVLIHADDGQEARVQAAFDLVRALHGHLIAIDVTAMTPMVEDPMIGPSAAAAHIAEELETQDANRTRITARLTLEDLPWSLAECMGDVAGCLESHTALTDLVVINTVFDGFPGGEMDGVVATMLRANRPVLAVPAETRGIALHGTALVAWDGSDESDAALRAAVPLLSLSREVRILSIDRGGLKHPPELAARYLSRHGIRPDIALVQPESGRIGQQILSHALQLDPALIVMGGFGHSRLFETLFGGVTRDLLHNSPYPVFLSQ
ncbi:nucleotide-binding universal stress UspA family protein [Sphingomonas sp. BE123]|jgi:nucleotide-binding universal stress UspA family protein|uniref:universal stress protein n=1 Tax=unclassified Sphingomonas TaxID=196159 RepID=UPI0028654EF9|nr:universal stress protein [Sphingomonas sp. BE123]MDR6850760.1 nucleotide-binding universal stress UspA family protein [Sphingomonas sp. BE123]